MTKLQTLEENNKKLRSAKFEVDKSLKEALEKVIGLETKLESEFVLFAFVG